MKINKYLSGLFLLVIFLILSHQVSFASNPVAPSIGKILPPPGTEDYILAAPGDNIAILFFISRMIRLIMIIAGVWSAVMITMSGYTFITSAGDAGAFQKVRSQLTNSIIGLVIIFVTYTITGVISLILFGDAGFILNPEITPIP